MSRSGNVSPSLARRIAEAIARAEGYYVLGSLPSRLNNPGSLKGSTGSLRWFSTPAEGWRALEDQVRRMLAGTSMWYKPSMTIREVAKIYTGGDKPDAWASIVSKQLKVTPDTRLSELV